MTHNDIKRTPKTTCTDPNKVDNAGRTKLFSSTSSGRLDKVKELIKRGANVNHRDNAGWCPLHEAAVKGQYEIMRYLISSGASVNVRGCEEDTPLHDACKSRFPDCVRLLVESGADVFALNLKRQKPIDVCDDEDCIEMVQARMKQLDDLASKDEQGRTCLHRACLEGDQEEALRLLRQGADANARDHAMWSPLHCAVERQHVALVRLLVQHGADVNGCKQDGAGALHIACQKQHETIVTYLVESGADVQAKDKMGTTPYQHASSATIRSIITSRIDEVRKQRAKTEAIDEATFQSNTQQQRRHKKSNENATLSREERKIQAIMKTFEKADKKKRARKETTNELSSPKRKRIISSSSREGSVALSPNNNNNNKKQRLDPFKKDSAGRTHLFKSAKQGNMELAETLLQQGANPRERDNAGYTPLHAATLHGKTDMVKILLQHDADANERDGDLDTPLHDAAENGFIEIVNLLLEYGAVAKVENKNGLTPLALAGDHDAIQDILRNQTELETKKLALELSKAKANASRHLPKKKTTILTAHSVPNSPPEQWHDFVGPKEVASLYTIQHLNQLHVVDLQLALLLGLNDIMGFHQHYPQLTRYPIDLQDKAKLWSPLSSMLHHYERDRFLSSDLCYIPLDQVRPLLDHALVTIPLDMGQSVKLPPKFAMKIQKKW